MRGIVHPDAEQPARVATLRTGAELLAQMPAKMEDARIGQRVARLLRALPLLTVLLVASLLVKAELRPEAVLPREQAEKKGAMVQKNPALKRRGPKL
jgi:hypothetical protein